MAHHKLPAKDLSCFSEPQKKKQKRFAGAGETKEVWSPTQGLPDRNRNKRFAVEVFLFQILPQIVPIFNFL
jgi:hypothetical protein